MAAQVGALRVTLGANTAQYEAGMRRAQAQARATGQNIQSSMVRAQRATTTAFSTMKSAAAGFGIGIATAGIAGFAGLGRAALEYAANLGETAQQTGVTVEQLQILNRIGVQNNITTEAMQRSLALLNRRLGEAKAGMESAIRPFKGLGFTQEQLRTFGQGGDILRVLAQRIMAIPDPARQAAAAAQIFGRQGMQLIPTLRAVAEGYDEAAAEARRMGLVTEEQATKADALMDEYALLVEVLQTRLAVAMAEGTGGLRSFTLMIGDAIDWLGQAANSVRSAGDAIAAWTDEVHLAVAATHPWLGQLMQVDEIQSRIAGRGVGAALGNMVGDVVGGPFFLRGAMAAAGQVVRPSSGAPQAPVDFSLASGGRSRRGRGNADRERQKAIREEAQFQSDLRRFRADLLRAQQEQVTDSVARSMLEGEILAIEREQYAADLQLQRALGDLTEAKEQQLLAAYDAVDNERRQGLSLERQREIAAEERQIAEARFNIAGDVLRQEADMAQTAAERRDIEMRLLDHMYRQERARLEAVIADETASRAAVEEARLRMAGLDQWRSREGRSIQMRTMGPIESFLDRLPTTAAKANEALEAVAANGLQSIEDSLVSLLDGTKSVADAFSSMAKSIISDLIRIQIQRSIIGPLANALGGSLGGIFGGGGGSILDEAMRFAPGAFASGGSFMVGGRAGVDRNLLSLNGMPVARVSKGETVGVGWGGRSGGKVEIILRDAMLDARIEQGAGIVVSRAAPAIIGATQGRMADKARRQ